MLPYSRGLILDNTSNYGIVKTETLFGFAPNVNTQVNEDFNETKPMKWIITSGNFEPRSVQERETRDLKAETPTNQAKSKKTKSSKRRTGKVKAKKCIFKVVRKNEKKNKRTGNKYSKVQKKYMMPLLLGLLAAKSLLIPIALKALAFMSTKGLMMGFFSTVMASVLSLKGMFDNNHGSQNRKDDTKTQVEIIQVPSKSEDHIYYDDHYKKGDYVPVFMN